MLKVKLICLCVLFTLAVDALVVFGADTEGHATERFASACSAVCPIEAGAASAVTVTPRLEAASSAWDVSTAISVKSTPPQGLMIIFR